jgi:3-(3-hydroxy-phenyl)propionate hydroxylase
MAREFVPYPFDRREHPPLLPALEAGVDPARHPVVIAGGGPVGLCAALGLARHGVPVVLLEKDSGECQGSRAICFSRRSLEILDRLGALAPALAEGLPWTGGRSYYRQSEVFRFAMPADAAQRLPPMINLSQSRLEAILYDQVATHRDLIEVRWQSEVASIVAGPTGARLGIMTPAGDYYLDADWVVACDGGRSRLRDLLGLRLEGTSYEGRYVIVDIRMDSDRPAERLAYFDPPCNPGSTVLVHKQPAGIWRIDYQLGADEDPEAAVRPENVVPRVESLLAMMGEEAPWNPVWIALYRASALTLPRYREGRVLFAGDAAHLVPIFGVRGANSGIDDADNLAWKLALVIGDRADEALLDSYSDERVGATHENLAYGTKSTEFMAPPSFAFDLLRTAVLSLAERHPEVRPLINPRQTLPIAYDDSPLRGVDEGALFAAGPGAGAVLPECPVTLVEDGLARAAHVTDLLMPSGRPGFTALCFADGPTPGRDLLAIESACARIGLGFRALAICGQTSDGATRPYALDAAGRLGERYDGAPGTVYLVRPDGHVLGRWRRFTMAAFLNAMEPVLGSRLELLQAAL